MTCLLGEILGIQIIVAPTIQCSFTFYLMQQSDLYTTLTYMHHDSDPCIVKPNLQLQSIPLWGVHLVSCFFCKNSTCYRRLATDKSILEEGGGSHNPGRDNCDSIIGLYRYVFLLTSLPWFHVCLKSCLLRTELIAGFVVWQPTSE